MTQVTLSLCIIAKNEAENISKCINSVKKLVDEIIVVDTGSTDNTRQVAQAHGARVIETDWQDDFSLARNISLENATGDWIFFLDCDEELSPESCRELREVIKDDRYEAYLVEIINIAEPGTKLIAPSIRLFKNRNCFRFTGKIHEQITHSIINNYGPQKIGHTDIKIIHHGYNAKAANIPAKILRNLQILNKYADEEKNGFFYYNLGTEYLRLGDKEKALSYFLKASKLTHPGQGYGPIMVTRTITILMDLHKYREALTQLAYYQAIYKEFKDLYLLAALCHYACGRYSQAQIDLEHYGTMPPSPRWYPTETSYSGISAEELQKRLNILAINLDTPRLSVCIIGRNESIHISRCIQSVNEIAAELIYVDTGSTDNTPVLAHQLGAQVYNMSWQADFAQAKNFALDKAKKEWILMLNADEALADQGREQIVNLLKESTPEVYMLKIHTFLTRGFSTAGSQVTGSCRLFRTGTTRYQGRVFTKTIHSPGLCNPVPVDVDIIHFHYQSNLKYINQKRQWKLDMIRQDVNANPALQSYALGVESFYAQDFITAVNHFETCLNTSNMTDNPSFFYFMSLSLMNTKQYQPALELLDKALLIFPDYTDLVYLKAIIQFMLGKAGEAEKLFYQCLEMGETPWEKYVGNPGTGSFKAMCSLATIFIRKGEYEKALQYVLEAANFPGGFEQAMENLVILQDKLTVSVDKILQSRGLFNSSSISLLARSYAKMGHYKESLSYLNKAIEQLEKESPRQFSSLINAIEMLLWFFWNQALNSLPQNSPLKTYLIPRS